MRLTEHMSRQVAVESSVTDMPRRVVQRRTPFSTFPEGLLGAAGRGQFDLFLLAAFVHVEELPSFSEIKIAGELRRGLCRETPGEGLVMSWRGRGSCSVTGQDVLVPSGEMSLRDVLINSRREDGQSSIRFDKPQQESPG